MPKKRIDMQAAAAYWAKITGTPRPHRGTLIRWATKGVRGRRLEAELLAGRWYTTADAVDELVRHMTHPEDRDDDGHLSPTRAAQVGRAFEELDAMIERKPSGRRRKEGAA